MRKTIICALMLFAAVTAWAKCTITSGTDGSITIAIDAPGDLAKAFPNGSGVSSLKTATDFKFTGKLNSDDIRTMTAENFGGTSPSGDVYFDFSDAELTEGTDFTAFNHGTVKYIVLPDGTEKIDVNDFPSNVQEMLAVNSTKNLILLYASANSDGRVSHLLSYTNKWKQPSLTNMTLKLYGTFKDVFGQMLVSADNNTGNLFKPTVIDLSAASFPTFTEDDSFVKGNNATLPTVSGDEYTLDLSGTWPVESAKAVKGKANGLAELNMFSASVETILFPTDNNTELLPMKSCFGMKNLSGELVIPGNIKTIGASAFDAITSNAVTIKGATEIGIAAFANAKNITDISLPQGLKTVEPFLFSGCSNLHNVELPEGVTRIEEFAFGTDGSGTEDQSNGLQLHAIRLPNTLEYIGKEAFRLNRFLKTLTIPANVQKIESNAFGLCTSLTDVYFLGTETIPVVAYDAFDKASYFLNNNIGESGIDENGEYKYVSQAKTFTNGDQCMAILHYPIVSVRAEYKEMTTAEINAYNAAVAATDLPEEIYTKTGDDSYELYSGVPVKGTTYYSKSFTTGETTATTSQAVEDVTKYYSDATGTTETTPQLKDNTYYTASEEPNYVQVNPEDVTDPATKFYNANNGDYIEATVKFSDGRIIYYKDADGNIQQVTSQTVFMPGTEYYRDANCENKVTNWSGVLTYTWPLYRIDGTKTVYTAATEYVYGTTYYAQDNGSYTVAETPEFNGTYYYYPQEANYAAVDETTITNITALRSYRPYIATTDSEGNTTYTKVEGKITVGEGESCMTLVTEACDDLYGQYYTDLERNAKYTGIPSTYKDGTYTPLNVDYKWPVNPDGKSGTIQYRLNESWDVERYEGDPQAGLKNFRLVAGWKEDGSTYTPSTPAPRIDRNIWYTFCVPANLSKQVIAEAFGGETQVCRFLGIKKDTKKYTDGSESYIIDFSVDMMKEKKEDGTVKYDYNDIVIESCVPYMIHPSTQPESEGGFIKPSQYYITGSTGYEYELGMPAKSYFGDYDPENGIYKANTEACANYLSGYKFVGNIDKHTRSEFCYYFGNVWKEGDTDHTQYPELQAFWSYEGEKAEGWMLNLSVCSGYIVYAGNEQSTGTKPNMVELNFGVSYDDMEATGIKEITDETTGMESGDRGRDTQVYNLNGQSVGKSLSGLPKGVYIKGGKKYIVK